MRHGFLIIAHNQWWQLRELIKALDAEGHDLYIHVDKKAKDFNIADFNGITRYSPVYFFSEYEVFWGGFSQVQTELFLFEKSFQQKYDYYHLISGADLPIKSNREIDAFLRKIREKSLFCMITRNCRTIQKFHGEQNITIIFRIIGEDIRRDGRMSSLRFVNGYLW